jgi:hypothetical protein
MIYRSELVHVIYLQERNTNITVSLLLRTCKIGGEKGDRQNQSELAPAA